MMVEIDGAQHSGSGTIVRQAVAFAALTGRPVHIMNARIRRPNPGLRPQHIKVIEAIGDLVKGRIEGLSAGSQEVVFRPGALLTGRYYRWDIGSAGSTTMLALGVLPVLAFGSGPVSVDLHGGLFQDFAPSFFHLQHVMLPFLRRMGLEAEAEMNRPGYVPRGEGVLALTVTPVNRSLHSLCMDRTEKPVRIWGTALSSHLEERRVSHRMAEAANAVLAEAGYRADIEVRYETRSLQPGAALALFADVVGGLRLGADQAGARGRRAESIGEHVAVQLLEDLKTGATVDRFAADQLIPFAALADGESRFCVPAATDHVLANAWLAEKFLGAQVHVQDRRLLVRGIGFRSKDSRFQS
jgi:RNA 3'-terminal phosphate cyclase (ATP)